MIRTGHLRPAMLGVVAGLLGATAVAEEVVYTIDAAHTYPSFEADHQGLSYWRGKFNSSSGSITLDTEAETGSVAITIDMNSIDFGHDRLNTHAMSADMFDVEQFPTATYEGTLTSWADGQPTAVEGTLTMHGVSQPVNLEIRKFACRPDGSACGADAYAEINRADFGVNFGAQMGMDMNTVLRIQVEARAEN